MPVVADLDELVTDGVPVTIGAEGIGPGPGVNGEEGIGTFDGSPESAGAEGIGASAGDDGAGGLGGCTCDGKAPEGNGTGDTNPIGLSCDGTGAEGTGADPTRREYHC